MSLKFVKTEFFVWLQWVLLTLAGFLVSLLFIEIGEKPDIGAFEGAIGGAVIGLAQWFFLRSRISNAGWWVLVCVLSWGLLGVTGLGALGWFTPRTPQIPLRIVYGAINGEQMGLLIGLAQWLVIGKQVTAGWRWIITSSVCWAVALAIGWTVGGLLHQATGLFLGEVVGLAVAWIVAAATTGIPLVCFLNSH
ncbi:hypothetical protein [Microcoleus sp. FACHB-672]|uniref:hypothetical protein n=1 Tax=Microcoleus sp. FACHB-672 TaxID=2692825 RepID=UPI002814C21A|nr:hypothetical protein [Microcoleus sp. FACHB-672]